GFGAVFHTINPRLHQDQIVSMTKHDEDRRMLVELGCIEQFMAVRDRLETVETVILLTDRAHMPADIPPDVLCYEELLAAEDGDFEWPDFDERSASTLCYTSGTTGHPKGVLYSHRSTMLQAMGCASPNSAGVSHADTILAVVALFHGNGWSIPYLAPMTGAKLVLPGRDMTMEFLHRLIKDEGVTLSMAVPTVWLSMLQYLEETGEDLAPLGKILTGGSAPPSAMMETLDRQYGVTIRHCWGMTETQAAAVMSMPSPDLDATAAALARTAQGTPLYGHDMRLVDDESG
ncbi:MAG: long-chain fatty acid--CoA ligase, partial [bacterium]|nr:long-chain fatty acid--CoA ligase [bacterium]